MPAFPALPGPRYRAFGLPLPLAMRRDYLGYCARLHEKHGDLVATRVVNERMLDLFDPELVRAALVDQADALLRWERGTQVFAQYTGRNVLVAEGEHWQRQRRMLQPAFTPRRVAGHAALMQAAAEDGLARLLAQVDAGREVDIAQWLSVVTMDAILRTLFSAAAGAEAATTAQAMQVLGASALREMLQPWTLPDWLPLPGKAAKRRALAHLRGLIAAHIAARRAAPPASGDAPDLLSMLLALRDEATGAGLSAQEVYDQCMVTFQAGHETSAAALLWWSVLMARHPQAQQRARDEVHAAVGHRAPGPDDLPALPWLGATLKEAMRLFPPIAGLLTRRNLRPIMLGGHEIPARTMLRVTPWVLHRDARWFPEPEAFRPERFLPGAPPLPRGAYIPFGLGPRVCLGQHFAMLEMTQLAAMLLQRVRLAWPEGAPPPRPELHVTLRPAGPVRLRLLRTDAAPAETPLRAAA